MMGLLFNPNNISLLGLELGLGLVCSLDGGFSYDEGDDELY
jgi:hypothetical protein